MINNNFVNQTASTILEQEKIIEQMDIDDFESDLLHDEILKEFNH